MLVITKVEYWCEHPSICYKVERCDEHYFHGLNLKSLPVFLHTPVIRVPGSPGLRHAHVLQGMGQLLQQAGAPEVFDEDELDDANTDGVGGEDCQEEEKVLPEREAGVETVVWRGGADVAIKLCAVVPAVNVRPEDWSFVVEIQEREVWYIVSVGGFQLF